MMLNDGAMVPVMVPVIEAQNAIPTSYVATSEDIQPAS